MPDKHFNCYTCQFRGTIPGDCHSRCTNPKSSSELNIQGSLHGIRQGWFLWPMNFDPTWLENCDGHKPVQVEEK